jgi:hypothetical protein
VPAGNIGVKAIVAIGLTITQPEFPRPPLTETEFHGSEGNRFIIDFSIVVEDVVGSTKRNGEPERRAAARAP